jgi:mRNA-degrading endonuclease YafQ of YafQ-DinJ toxin-antitoxin module
VYQLIFTPAYEKRLKKFLKKHLEIKKQYAKTMKLMEINPFHSSLRIHPLSGKLKQLHSISINISYRISIEFIVDDKTIIPVNIGTHDEVYKN